MKNVLITGGAGFIGSNLADRLISNGYSVTIYDSMARKGTVDNVNWLGSKHGRNSFELISADVRDFDRLNKASYHQDVIYHLAAQVAVTTSVVNPREDFEINSIGTFNALEATRLAKKKPIFIYASTNKVYGGMENISVLEGDTRYYYQDLPLGVSERQPLDFHSPYGCSKGAGDQYARDYARIYGIRTVVFRQSCIYGPRQFGIEDQGWIAWFIIAAVTGNPITIYGDGKQTRDVLYISDMINAYQAAIDNIDLAAGNVYNIGGGHENSLSIWNEFGPLLEDLLGKRVEKKGSGWRPGDQRVYISDIRKAKTDLGWQPIVNIREGLEQLVEWVRENKQLFCK